MYGLEAHQVLTVITVFVHTNSVRRLAWKFTILPELLRFKVLTLHAISRCIPLCVTVPSLHAVYASLNRHQAHHSLAKNQLRFRATTAAVPFSHSASSTALSSTPQLEHLCVNPKLSTVHGPAGTDGRWKTEPTFGASLAAVMGAASFPGQPPSSGHDEQWS